MISTFQIKHLARGAHYKRYTLTGKHGDNHGVGTAVGVVRLEIDCLWVDQIDSDSINRRHPFYHRTRK